MLLVALAVGALIGATLGALGGGGSILTVPALVYLLGQGAHEATTVSLAVVGVSALVAVVAHARAKRVAFADGAIFGVLGVAGSFAGSRLSAGVDPQLLMAAFAVLMLLAAGAMAVRALRPPVPLAVPAPAPAPELVPTATTTGATGTTTGATTATRSVLPTAPEAVDPRIFGRSLARRSRLVLVAAATGVGLLTGFFGVGGGFVVVPVLVVLLGFEMPLAVGTSLLVISLNSAASLLARLGTPVHADWAVVGAFAAAAVAGTFAGARLSARIRPKLLATSFTVLLVVVAVYTLGRSVPHLV